MYDVEKDIMNVTRDYDGDSCWQYHIREQLLLDDLQSISAMFGVDEDEILSLKVSDFEFRAVYDAQGQSEIKDFIVRYEWLGNMSQYPTHWYACYYQDVIAGATVFNMPNAFSKYLGEDTPRLERLISRGACASWTPKNLASALLMFAIKHMVANTEYRLFTAYSDPTAKELGTIYQACNFWYLGNNYGAAARYVNPYTGKLVSDRFFRQRTAYRRYAKELGIEFQSNWADNTKMLWQNIPDHVEQRLREYSREKQRQATRVEMPLKHKYAYVLGRDKRETKELRRQFLNNVKTVHEYPKERGR